MRIPIFLDMIMSVLLKYLCSFEGTHCLLLQKFKVYECLKELETLKMKAMLSFE